MTLRVLKVYTVLSLSAEVSLENIAVVILWFIMRKAARKIFLSAVAEGGTGPRKALHDKLNLMTVVQ